MSFPDYIRVNDIKVIIWSEELDIIAAERPLWNSLYGNVYSYYDKARVFLEKECSFEGKITDRTYPVRIADYIGKKDYEVRFYMVTPDKEP